MSRTTVYRLQQEKDGGLWADRKLGDIVLLCELLQVLRKLHAGAWMRMATT